MNLRWKVKTVALTFDDYVKIVGSPAMVGSATDAFISGGFTWFREGRERRHEVSLSVMLAAETLENFTRACVQTIHVDSEAQADASQ